MELCVTPFLSPCHPPRSFNLSLFLEAAARHHTPNNFPRTAGPNFKDGYEIVDRLDVKTLAPGKAYRFWFRAGVSQADTSYVWPHRKEFYDTLHCFLNWQGYISVGAARLITLQVVDQCNSFSGKQWHQSNRNSGVQRCRYLIPVLVTRGAKDPDSKILLVNSAVHGDELNGIRVVHMLFNQSVLPPSAITGTLFGIPGINQVCAAG